jgi:hypothetical protein
MAQYDHIIDFCARYNWQFLQNRILFCEFQRIFLVLWGWVSGNVKARIPMRIPIGPGPVEIVYLYCKLSFA